MPTFLKVILTIVFTIPGAFAAVFVPILFYMKHVPITSFGSHGVGVTVFTVVSLTWLGIVAATIIHLVEKYWD